MYGSRVPFNIDSDTYVYNLASFIEGPIKLRSLIPPEEIGRLVDYDFDINYANFIMGNNDAFIELYTLMLQLQLGKDIFILVSDTDWTENLVESLFKFIQQRYGYDGIRINNEEDYNHFKDKVYDFNTGYGLYNLDSDRDRYSYIVESRRIASGGEPCTIA